MQTEYIVFIAIITIAILMRLYHAYNESKVHNYKIERDIQAGNAYELPPKYFVIPLWAKVLFVLVLAGSTLLTLNTFFDYLHNLIQNCEPIWGLNALLVREIARFTFATILFIGFLAFDFKNLLSVNKPYWFAKKVIYVDNSNHKDIKSSIVNTCIMFIGLIILNAILSPISLLQNEASSLDISTINSVYQQKCIANEYPFDNSED